MAIHDKYFPGSTVSRYLPPGEHSWAEAVYQSGKPVLDAELNLSQEVGKEIRRLIQHHETPSGWLRGPIPLNPSADLSSAYAYVVPSDALFVADGFYMERRTAIVANMPVTVAYTDTDAATDGGNLIQLSTAPVNGGAPPDVKRTDFVFLEVFRALVSASPHASGTALVDQFPTTDTIVLNGVNLIPAGGPRGVGTGANNYDNTLASAAAIAADIRDAVNDTSNGFAVAATAEIDLSVAEQVNLRATDAFAGAAGNAINFLTIPGVSADFTLSGAGALVGGVDTPNKPTQATIYRNGNVQAPASVNLEDRIADPTIGTESTKRVQVQYRTRATGQAEEVNFQVTNGFIGANWIKATAVPSSADSAVQAQGTMPTPVSRYRFVPADGITVLAYIDVTGVGVIAPGDTILVNGITLTAVNIAPAGDEFDVSSGVPATIATSIVAAITASVATVASSATGSLIAVVPATQGGNVTLSTVLTTATAVITAVNSAVSYQTVDNGLYIAGDGTEKAATDLGTVDGYSYAIPMCFAFRRNDATATGGFDPENNTNGALAYDHALYDNLHLSPLGVTPIDASVSDRPDRYFHDVIVKGDVLDLRRHVSPGGVDLKAELESQMTALLDGNFHTWAIDTEDITELGNASGDVSSVYLVCNEVGDQDNVNGKTIGTWDHVRRRFADQPVVERRIFPLLPTAASGTAPGLYVTPPAAGWATAAVINVDLDSLDASGLGDWAAPAVAGPSVAAQWPTGTTITNVLRVVHDDGNYAVPISQDVEIDLISGVGTAHVEITLAPNASQANGGVSGAGDYPLVPSVAGGSPRRIFVELEISYPAGSGLSATPDETITPDPAVTAYHGAALEYNTSKRPTDFEDLPAPAFRSGYREVGLEYICNDGLTTPLSGTPISEQVVSGNGTNLVLSRRLYGVKGAVPSGFTVTDIGGALGAVPVDAAATAWGNSERKIVLTGAGVAPGVQSLCNVEYWAQDPIPDYSNPGDSYQISVYYRSNAPQTVGVMGGFPATSPLPDAMKLQPLVMSRSLWTNTTSVGSLDLAFPYSNPSDQIAVNADLANGPNPPWPGGSGPSASSGEWVLMSLAKISVGDFDADTGLLNLNQMVPVDPNSNFSFSSRAWDSDFRGHYRIADTGSYRPTAMSQPLSGVATHKVFLPFLAQTHEDNVYFRRGEVVLVVVSRYALLDGDNVVRFTDGGIDTCAAIYRTRGLLLLASER